MSKETKLSESGQVNYQRENVTKEETRRDAGKPLEEKTIDAAILERLTNRNKGALSLALSEKNDPDFDHMWVNSDIPGRVQDFLDIGATIVQYKDFEGKELNHTAQRGHEGKMLHMKIPKHINKKREELRHLAHRKDQKVYKEDANGNPVAFEKRVVTGIPTQN